MRVACRIIIVMFVSVFLDSCAIGPPLKPFPMEAVSTSKARIHITRSTDFLYMALDARVSVNGEVVAALPRGEFTYVDVLPGNVLIRVDHPSSPGAFAIKFRAKQGSTYSVEVSPRNESFIPGVFLGVIGLAIDASITENSGLFMLRLISSKGNGHSNIQQQKPIPDESVKEQLKRLKKLREDGLIEVDVYKEEQKRILSK